MSHETASRGTAEPTPCVCLAILIADSVVREAGTGKPYILGAFDQIMAANYPTRVEQFHLYLAVTELQPGKHEGRIRVEYLDDARTPLLEAHGPLEAGSPLEVINLNFAFRGVVFPKPGPVEIAFFLDGRPVQSRKVRLVKLAAA